MPAARWQQLIDAVSATHAVIQVLSSFLCFLHFIEKLEKVLEFHLSRANCGKEKKNSQQSRKVRENEIP